MLKIKLNHPNAQIPKQCSVKSAGYDLCSVDTTTIEPHKWKLIDTGISFTVPDKTYGRIAPRSGLAVKNGIDVHGGVIDADYTGPVKVILMNHSDVAFNVNIGDRIAQLIIEKIEMPQIEVVGSLNQTERGDNGFGSTSSSTSSSTSLQNNNTTTGN